MSRRSKGSTLTHDGTTYRIADDAVRDLVARGIIEPDEEDPGAFRLSPDHVFDEVDPFATPLSSRPAFDPRSRLVSMLVSHRDGQGP